MFYDRAMDALARLKLLSNQMTFEPDLEQKPVCFSPKEERSVFVHPAQMPNGQSVKLLKTLLSSACERDCFYCPFRAGRDFRRATFKPEEFAKLFMQLHRSRLAEGVFLSSGIAAGGIRTQDKLRHQQPAGVWHQRIPGRTFYLAGWQTSGKTTISILENLIYKFSRLRAPQNHDDLF